MAIKRINPSRNAYDNQNRTKYGYCIRVPKLPDAHQFVEDFVVFNDVDNCFYRCVKVDTTTASGEQQLYYTWRKVTFGAGRAFLIPVGKLSEVDKHYITIEDTEKATVQCLPKTLNEIVFGLRRYDVVLEPLGFVRTSDTTFQSGTTYYGYKWNDTIGGITLEQRKAFSGELVELLRGTKASDKTDGMYVLTTDTTFQPRTVYFVKSGTSYVEATIVVGDPVPENTYYNKKHADFLDGETIEAGEVYELGMSGPEKWEEITKLDITDKMTEITEILNEHGSTIPYVSESDTLYKICETMNLIIDEVNPFSIPWQLLLNRMNKIEIQVGPGDMQEVSDTLLNTRVNLAAWASAQWQFLFFLTKDTTYDPSKTYYTRSEIGGTLDHRYVYTVMTNPGSGTVAAGTYEKMALSNDLLYGTMCQVDESTLELLRYYDSKIGNIFDLVVDADTGPKTLVDWLKQLEARFEEIEKKILCNTEGIRQLRLAIGHIGYMTAEGTVFQEGVEYYYWDDTYYYFVKLVAGTDYRVGDTFLSWSSAHDNKLVYSFIGGKTAANLIANNAVNIARYRRDLDKLLGMELRKIYLETFAETAVAGTDYFFFDPYAGAYTFSRVETEDAQFANDTCYYWMDAGSVYHMMRKLDNQTKYKVTTDQIFMTSTTYYTRSGSEGAYVFTAATVVAGEAVPPDKYYVVNVDTANHEYLVGDDIDPDVYGDVYVQSETNPKFVKIDKVETNDETFVTGKEYFAVKTEDTGEIHFIKMTKIDGTTPGDYEYYIGESPASKSYKVFQTATVAEPVAGADLDVYRELIGPILIYSTTDEAVDQIRENNEQIAHLKYDLWVKYNDLKKKIDDTAGRANRLKELTGVAGDTADVDSWNVDGYKQLTSGVFEEYVKYYTMEDKGKDVDHLYHELVSGTPAQVLLGTADYVVPYFALTDDTTFDADTTYYLYNTITGVYSVARKATHPRDVSILKTADYYVPGYYATDDLTYEADKSYYIKSGDEYIDDPAYNAGDTIDQTEHVVYEYDTMVVTENTFYEKIDPTPITEDYEPKTVDGEGIYIRKAHKEDGGYEEHNTHRGMIDRNTSLADKCRSQCGAFEKWTKRQLKAVEDFVLSLLLSTLDVITQERSTLSLLHQTVGKLIVIHNALERLNTEGQTFKPADGVYDSGYVYYKATAFAITDDQVYIHGKRYFVKKLVKSVMKYVVKDDVVDGASLFSRTTDTEVQSGTTYYEYDSENDTYTAVTPEAGDNPYAKGWYVKAEVYEASTFEEMTNEVDYEVGLECSSYAYTKDLVIATTENYTINEIRLAVNRILNYHIISQEMPTYTELPDDTIILETMTYWRYVDDEWEKIVPEEADPTMIGQRVKDYDPSHKWYIKTSDDIPDNNYTETPCRIFLNELIKLHHRDSSLSDSIALMNTMTGGLASAETFINSARLGLV